MANAIINILECNNSRIRLVVTQGDNPLSRVTIFTNGVERAFWTSSPLNNEKSYNWQTNHFNDGLNEIRVNARDNQGNVVSEFRYIIKGLDENSTLSEIITENENIKNDISDLITRFKSNLINKNVEVTDEDKMSTLIDKINDISGVFEEPAVKLRLFHADSNTYKLYELDVNTLQPIKTVNALSTYPKGIGGGFDGNKLRLFHTDSNTYKLYELDVNTLQPIKTVNALSNSPIGIGGGFDGNKLRLFHVDYNPKYIYELDVDTLQPIKTVNSPSTMPYGIGGGFDGNKLRLFHTDSNIKKIYELDIDTLQPIKTVNSPSTMPYGIGGGFDGNKLRLFHTDSNTYKLYELDVNTLQPIKTVNSPGTIPYGIGGGHYTINKKYVIHNGVKYELKEV